LTALIGNERREGNEGADEGDRGEQSMRLCAVRWSIEGLGPFVHAIVIGIGVKHFFCQLNLCGYALPVYVVYLGGGPVRSEALVRPHRMHLPRAGPRSCSKPCQTYPRKDDDGVTTMTTVPEDGSKDPKPIDSLSDNSRFAPLT
jgi:hypothetical protein